MPAYALAHLRETDPHPEILDPFAGRFIVHGGTIDVREGSWPGNLVVIAFPSMGAARAWYDSPAYRQILPLRTGHIAGDAILVEGVERGHDSARMAAELRAANWA